MVSTKSKQTIQQIKAMIAEVCDLDAGKIRDNGKLLGYGLDSVRVIDLLMAIEDVYGIEISESDPALGNVQTVADLSALVDARRSG